MKFDWKKTIITTILGIGSNLRRMKNYLMGIINDVKNGRKADMAAMVLKRQK